MTHPFLFDYEGKIRYFNPDTTGCIKATLYRKYPVIEYVHKYARLINEGEFEAANDPQFSKAVTIHRINDGKAVGHEIDIPDTIGKYRYWRYIQRKRYAHCNMSEIFFYERNTGKLLSGNVIGTEGHRTFYKGMTRETLFDHNLLTSFNSPNPRGDWSGMDFGKAVNIGKIIFYGRGDGNTVEPDDIYELLYYNSGKWMSLGRKKAAGISVSYDNIPKNALLLLRDLTKGKDERIFTISSTGDQIWW